MSVNETKSAHVDPVCGMNVEPETAAGMSRVAGKAYYFCSLGCNQKFDADPARYLGQPGGAGGSCCGGGPAR